MISPPRVRGARNACLRYAFYQPSLPFFGRLPTPSRCPLSPNSGQANESSLHRNRDAWHAGSRWRATVGLPTAPGAPDRADSSGRRAGIGSELERRGPTATPMAIGTFSPLQRGSCFALKSHSTDLTVRHAARPGARSGDPRHTVSEGDAHKIRRLLDVCRLLASPTSADFAR